MNQVKCEKQTSQTCPDQSSVLMMCSLQDNLIKELNLHFEKQDTWRTVVACGKPVLQATSQGCLCFLTLLKCENLTG